MLKRKNFIMAAALLFAVSSPAVAQYGQVDPTQFINEGFPTNVQPGECYSRCLAPAVYEDVEEEIEIAPAMERTEIIPAEYEWVDEQVMAKEASEQIETLPAKFEWQEEEVVVKDASEEIKVIPARYEWVDEQVVVKEATEELKSVPARYEWIEEQVRLGRNGMSIYQDLVERFGFTHKYNSVKRFVRGLKKKDPRQYDRLEFLPGPGTPGCPPRLFTEAGRPLHHRLRISPGRRIRGIGVPL